MTTEKDPSAPARVGGFASVPRRVRWFIYLVSFSAVGYGYLTVVITAYLPELNIGPGSVGLIMGVVGLTLVFSAIPLGILSDRVGRKWIVISGTLILPPGLLIFAFTTDISHLVVAGIMAGIGEGAFLSTWNAIIADQTTTENRNAAFSLSFVVSTATMGLGFALPVFFPPLQNLFSVDSYTMHRAFIIITAGLSVPTPVGTYLLLRGYVDTVAIKKGASERKSLRPLLKFSGINSLIGLGAGFIIPLIPTWLYLRFAVPDTFSGPLLALSNVTIGLSAIASPLLARRYGNVRAIVLTQALATVFMFSLAFMVDPITASGLYLVRAALMNMSSPLSDSFLMGIVPPEQRGLASAVNSLIWRLPNSASTVIGGIILESGNYALPFFLATGFYAISVTLFFAVFRNVKPTE